MQKKQVLFIIRIILSLGILAFILTRIDINLFISTIKNFAPHIYIIAVILLFLQQYLLAIGWKMALLSKGYTFHSTHIFKSILTSGFFGIVLPSTFAADLIMTFFIGRSIPEKHHAPSALMYIRMLNILFLVIISVIFMNAVPQLSIFRTLLLITLLCILIFYLISLLWLKYLAWMEKYYITRFIYKIFYSFTEFSKNMHYTSRIIPIMIIASFARIALDYLLARSIGIELPLTYYLAIVPIVMIVSIVPISIAGLGVRESIYVFLFSLIGLPKAIGFSISLLVFSLSIWSATAGGIIYLFTGHKLKQHS